MYWKSIIPALLLLFIAPFSQAQTQQEDFDHVAKHLETGGDLYMYINIRGDIAKFAVKGNLVIQAVRDIVPEFAAKVPPLDYAQLEKHFQFSSLSAMGLSSKQVEGADYYRLNVFYNIGGEPQGIWRMIPNKPEPVSILKLTPPDATQVIEMSIDFMPLKESIVGCFSDIMGDNGKVMVDGALQTLVPQTEVSIDALLQALSTRIGGFVIMNEGDDESMERPIRLNKFLICFRGAGQTLAKLRPWMESINATVTETANYLNMEVPTAAEIGTNIVLQISKSDGDAYLSSSINLLEECRGLKSTIVDTDEYKKYSKDLPSDVVSFVYLTHAYGENLRNNLNTLYAQMAEKMPTEQQSKSIQLIANLMDGFLTHYVKPQISTTIYSDGGMLANTNTGVSAKDQAVLIAAVVPAGLIAAMAIPAYQKVHQVAQEKAVNSQEKIITNNLRQIASASMQYMLDNGVEEVRYEDIVGAGKYIEEPIESVAGESYEDIVVTSETTSISVVTDEGQEVKYDF